jgi:hypothetical protein
MHSRNGPTQLPCQGNPRRTDTRRAFENGSLARGALPGIWRADVEVSRMGRSLPGFGNDDQARGGGGGSIRRRSGGAPVAHVDSWGERRATAARRDHPASTPLIAKSKISRLLRRPVAARAA